MGSGMKMDVVMTALNCLYSASLVNFLSGKGITLYQTFKLYDICFFWIRSAI